MWIFILPIGILTIIISIIYAVILKICHPYTCITRKDNYIGCLFSSIAGVVIIITSLWAGIFNYAQIPRLHQNIRLESINKQHYHKAMKYNLGDESNERHSASHVHRFRNGDFSEAKDNNTWKQNYNDWFYNKSHIIYHKMQLKYYSHPIHNWRDGVDLRLMKKSSNSDNNN